MRRNQLPDEPGANLRIAKSDKARYQGGGEHAKARFGTERLGSEGKLPDEEAHSEADPTKHRNAE